MCEWKWIDSEKIGCCGLRLLAGRGQTDLFVLVTYNLTVIRNLQRIFTHHVRRTRTLWYLNVRKRDVLYLASVRGLSAVRGSPRLFLEFGSHFSKKSRVEMQVTMKVN